MSQPSFKFGDEVKVTLGEATLDGRVALASDNGRSLEIELYKPIVIARDRGEPCAWAEVLLPWCDDDGTWHEPNHPGVELQITAVPRAEP
jgi:hypothetical protein